MLATAHHTSPLYTLEMGTPDRDAVTTPARFRLVPMQPRDPGEPGRVASTLELFFDLVFAIAVSIASADLHTSLTGGNVWPGITSYVFVFFSIWWAWMNFTWFSTSFDTDDWLYRVLTIVQMSGVLVLASGIGPAFHQHDYTVSILAYVVMRLALVAQWLRASRSAGTARRGTITYAVGISVVQVFWLAALLLPAQWMTAAVVAFIIAEISVPVFAERSGSTPWHPQHITERYGLFTLILLGLSLFASTNAIIDAQGDPKLLGRLIGVAALTLVTTAALWWIYFWTPHHHTINGLKSSLAYGYGHFFIFAAASALSAGIEVEIDVTQGQSALALPYASFAYTVPIAIFVLGIWLLAMRQRADHVVNTTMPLAAALV